MKLSRILNAAITAPVAAGRRRAVAANAAARMKRESSVKIPREIRHAGACAKGAELQLVQGEGYPGIRRQVQMVAQIGQVPVDGGSIGNDAEEGIVDLDLAPSHNLHHDAGTRRIADPTVEGQRRAAEAPVVHMDHSPPIIHALILSTVLKEQNIHRMKSPDTKGSMRLGRLEARVIRVAWKVVHPHIEPFFIQTLRAVVLAIGGQERMLKRPVRPMPLAPIWCPGDTYALFRSNKASQ